MAGTKRQEIVEAADMLFYQNGYEYTSFADIASAVNISRGNFYYHFKSKDDILTAVIARRFENTESILEQWESASDTPEERIRSFIHILIANKTKIKQFGCPVGTLTTELSKLEHPALPDANRLFGLFKSWLIVQFEALGFQQESPTLAMHLLARSQGVATLINAFKDDEFIEFEVAQMCDWLDEKIKSREIH
ncbi:putative Transcriptional regulator, TetR-like [Vibrio nigripulchritudo MADA3029]|uniref:Transcriptional regulator, TetR-like n=1 Tax=Vibrio nigripulchritudo SOn1 TaxID=1238450 RepID=A0AAV2VM07_9VIBR|nr:TetR/AcrR family transcriptional regulator [Vibrio nigripulchritudo]CCN47529.1 putative Transcriptional regulator, TetR-like [Vibrio nigripulchritudo MADA3020]CCN55937.1 putative Transcriptional regulator, TetR-like [Vibrio nigripulchritudo MADA3021]CCN57159.1 putative Transcriptional regulator, TetR-like [Vibrio nigripulchritudo MADA3029]CCN72290.1 putative Transcriptional regulator, TetR-like [Vibrio nigripulchritudo SFn118]CCO45514.1 putative Transcriptional regulator, TetR-like [Vibrio 